jgi:hypothetical protein
MFHPLTKLCCGVLAALLSAGAMAGNAFVGLRFGDAMVDRFDGIIAPAPGASVDTDTPLGLYGGWNFNAQWALELAYTDLGSVHLGNATPVNIVLGAGVDLDGQLLTVGPRYAYEMTDDLALLLAAGIFDLREDGSLSTFGSTLRLENDDRGYYAELGARYRVSGPVALRASWQWFDFDHGADGLPWLGAEFGF